VGAVPDKSSLLITAGAIVLATCGGADAPSGGPSAPLVTADASTPTSTTSPSASDPIASESSLVSAPAAGDLRSGLIAAGAAIESAPADVVASLQDPLCGVVLSDQPADHDSGSIQCLVNANEDRRPAALVVVVFTTEGDPLVEVWLSHPPGMSVAVDSTRDQFGVPGWSSRTCGDVTATAASDPWTSPLTCT
jgi:hypothetical protein